MVGLAESPRGRAGAWAGIALALVAGVLSTARILAGDGDGRSGSAWPAALIALAGVALLVSAAAVRTAGAGRLGRAAIGVSGLAVGVALVALALTADDPNGSR